MAETPENEKTSVAFKKPLTFKFVQKLTDDLVNYDLTWPELRAKAALHPNRLVLILHAMMHIIVMEDEAKRKLQGHQAGVAARLTAEELEKVFGGAGRTKARHGCQLRATKDDALSKNGF